MFLKQDELYSEVFKVAQNCGNDLSVILGCMVILDCVGYDVPEDQMVKLEDMLGSSRSGLLESIETIKHRCTLEVLVSILSKQAIQEKIFGDNVIKKMLEVRSKYKQGEPIWDDAYYDRVLELFSCLPEMEELRLRSYDDDGVPEVGVNGDYYEAMNQDKSFSIQPVTTYREFFEFVCKSSATKFSVSLKVNGINTKTLYEGGKYRITLSRGRAGDSINFTEYAHKIFPSKMRKVAADNVIVYAEAWVESDYLARLKQKYSTDKYKTERSAALSMLRTGGDEEDLGHLHLSTFAVGNVGDIQDAFGVLEEEDFEVVPHFSIDREDIPKEFDTFVVWCKENIFDRILKMSEKIPADGAVFEEVDFGGEKVTGQYSSKNIALKMEQYSYKYYVGVVNSIVAEVPKRVYGSLRVGIEPLVMQDGQTAKVINVFNPDILISNGINVGSKVYFDRASDAYSNLLFGDRLYKVLNG